MSVLTCPVCQGAMRELNKEGVLIDVCTQCRGVWLDRGELEKLSNLIAAAPFDGRQAPPYEPVAARGPAPYDQRPRDDYQRQPPRDDYRERRRDYDDDDDDHRRYGDRGHHKKSGFGRFLDIFD
jgi:uncharacterized protein